MSRHPLHNTWRNIQSRCNYKTSPDYHRYGGRGIKVLWRDFWEFVDAVGDKPSPLHSLDRIDNDGHYETSNVRWVLPVEQNRNMRCNRWVTWNGETLLLGDWAKRFGQNYTAFESCYRLHGMADAVAYFTMKRDGLLQKGKRAGGFKWSSWSTR